MKLRVPHWIALSVLTAAAVAACTDQSPVTGPLSPGAASRSLANPGAPFTVCTAVGNTTAEKSFNLGATYAAPTAVLNATNNQGVWHAPLTGSDWVKAPGDAAAPFTNYGVNAPDNVFVRYTTPFTVDVGFTATVDGGQSFVDNQVLSVTVDGAGASLASNALLDGPASVANYAGPAPLPWATSGSIAAGNHTIVVSTRNNDDIQPTNPTAVDYCFHVTQTPVPTTTWCSPGFWKNQGFDLWAQYHDNLYSSLGAGAAPLSKKAPPGDPTLATVIQNPSIYGGPATNSVADFLSFKAFGTPIGTGVESCPNADDITVH